MLPPSHSVQLHVQRVNINQNLWVKSMFRVARRERDVRKERREPRLLHGMCELRQLKPNKYLCKYLSLSFVLSFSNIIHNKHVHDAFHRAWQLTTLFHNLLYGRDTKLELSNVNPCILFNLRIQSIQSSRLLIHHHFPFSELLHLWMRRRWCKVSKPICAGLDFQFFKTIFRFSARRQRAE